MDLLRIFEDFNGNALIVEKGNLEPRLANEPLAADAENSTLIDDETLGFEDELFRELRDAAFPRHIRPAVRVAAYSLLLSLLWRRLKHACGFTIVKSLLLVVIVPRVMITGCVIIILGIESIKAMSVRYCFRKNEIIILY